MVEGQPAKVKDAEQDVSDDGGKNYRQSTGPNWPHKQTGPNSSSFSVSLFEIFGQHQIVPILLVHLNF